MKTKPVVSCIIPVYNEAQTIASVVETALAVTSIDQVIVVNDGSTDDTSNILGSFHHPKLISIALPNNQGKSAAFFAGLAKAHGSIILMLDADLVGLTTADIEKLLVPTLDQSNTAALAFLANAPRITHIMGVNAVSGQRAFPRSYADQLAKCTIKNYSLEVSLNKIILEQKARIVVVPWPHVYHRHKSEKRGFWRGNLGDIKMTWELIFRFGLPTLFCQYLAFERRANRDGTST